MLSQSLVSLITENADELSKRLIKDLYSREETKSFWDVSEDLMYERVFDVYSRLDDWLDRGSSEGIKRFYINLGRKRYNEGIPLHELILAFMLIKRHLWLFVLEKNFFETTYAISKSLELNNRVVLFFDRIIVAITIGYEEEILESAEQLEQGLFSKLFNWKK